MASELFKKARGLGISSPYARDFMSYAEDWLWMQHLQPHLMPAFLPLW